MHSLPILVIGVLAVNRLDCYRLLAIARVENLGVLAFEVFLAARADAGNATLDRAGTFATGAESGVLQDRRQGIAAIRIGKVVAV